MSVSLFQYPENRWLLKPPSMRPTTSVSPLNRQEKGKGELSAIQEVERDYQCKVLSIIDFNDLMQFIENEADYQQYLPAMRAYRESYGV